MKRDDDDGMTELYETNEYIGTEEEIRPWRDVPELALSDDEPDDPDPVPSKTKSLRAQAALMQLVGNERSGNWGHAGRIGQIGGSLPQQAPDSGSGGGPRRETRDERDDRSETYFHSPKDAVNSLLNGEKVNITREDIRGFLRAAGEQKEDPDLTDVQVEGMLIFGGNGLGILRDDMPQVPKAHRGRFIKELEEAGIKLERKFVSPLDLAPTQREISARDVQEKLDEYDEKGERKEFPPLLVAEDGHVLDGHHHWGMMAALAADDRRIKVPIVRLKTSVKEALKIMRAYMVRNKIPPKTIFRTRRIDNAYRQKLALLLIGNEHSGNYGHAGRPGEVGGSAPGGAASDDRTDSPDLPPLTEREKESAKYYRGKQWRRRDPETGQINHYHETMGQSRFKQVMSGPYPDEYYAMMAYLNNGYKAINTRLREAETEEVGFQSEEAHLDRLIDRNTLDQKATLYRSISPRVLAGLGEGDTFRDKGFVSTSWDRKLAAKLGHIDTSDRIVVEIEVEPGQPALEVEQYEGGDEMRTVSESEYLLPRGMTFTVVSKKGDKIVLRAHKPPKKVHR